LLFYILSKDAVENLSSFYAKIKGLLSQY